MYIIGLAQGYDGMAFRTDLGALGCLLLVNG
jgi:hypothetical protein